LVAVVAALGALHSGSAHATATTAAVTPRAGSYAGSVGPYTIDFKVSDDRKRITDLRTTYQPTIGELCVPGHLTTTRFPALSIARGRFSGSVALTSSDRYTIRGSFTAGGRASGTMRTDITFKFGPACNDLSSFSAKRVGG
jgi:hypothetical protein